MKKKLDGGLKKISIYLLFFIFSSNICYSSQILDYETEEFVKEIIELNGDIRKFTTKTVIKSLKYKFNE